MEGLKISTLMLQIQFSPVEVKVHILSSNMMPNFCRPIFMSVFDIQKEIPLFQPFKWWNRANFLTFRFNNSTTNLTIIRKKKLVKRGRGKHVITRNLRSRNWTLLALKKRDWNSKQGCFRGKCRAKNGVNSYLKFNYYLPFLWFIKMDTVKHRHKFNVRFSIIK